MIKIGIIGYGFAAQTFHIPLIESTPAFELHGIVTSKPDKVKALLPNIRVYATDAELLSDSAVDLVLITTPNTLHYPLAMKCLQHDRHVVVEKPMVCTSAEGEQLIEIAESRNLILSVFHNRRWDGDFLTVKKLMQAGEVGKVTCLESHFDRFRPVVRDRWREQPGLGSGIWYDLGSHLVDQALCLFGLPEAITAKCLAQRENSKAVDYFHVLLHYQNCEVILCASSFVAGPNRRFQLEGTKGTYVKYGLDPQEQQLKSNLSPTDPEFGHEESNRYGMLYTQRVPASVPTEPGCYLSYYAQLGEALQNNRSLPVTGAEGVRVMRLLEMAVKSSQEGRTLPLS